MNDPKRPGERPMSETAHCAQRADTLKAYVDGELTGLRRWQTRRHIERCRPCREESEALKRLSTEIQRLPEPVPRPELRTRILANLPTTPPARAVRPAVNLRQPRLAFGVAAFAGLVVGASALGRMSHLLQWASSAKPAQTHGSVTDAAGGTRKGGALTSQQALSGLTTPTQVDSTESHLAPDGAPPTAIAYQPHDLYSQRADEATSRELAHHSESDPPGNSVLRPEGRFGSGTTSDPFRLAVPSLDITAANGKLRRLTEGLGGTLASVGFSEASPARFRTFGRDRAIPYPGAAAAEPRQGLLLLARVPASQAEVLRHGLQELASDKQHMPIKPSAPKVSSSGAFLAVPKRSAAIHDPQSLLDGASDPIPSPPMSFPPTPSTETRPRPFAPTQDAAPPVMAVPSKPVDTTPTVGVTYLIWLRPAHSSHK